ncbi:MAG: hypothetical protein KF858_02365, partial [Candidatus Sumerlaeia bacterium]|nr:hypothetical protein [Candidatus Sumerlaeia bacterium]
RVGGEFKNRIQALHGASTVSPDPEPHVYIQSSSDGFLVFVGFIPASMPVSKDAIKLRGRDFRNIMDPQIGQVEYTYLVNPAGGVCGYAIWGGEGAHGFVPRMNQLFQHTPGFSIVGDYACFLLNRACGQWKVDERWSEYYFQLWNNDDATVLEIAEFPSQWANVAYDYTILRDDEFVP